MSARIERQIYPVYLIHSKWRIAYLINNHIIALDIVLLHA
jgi:hypothetical protein